MQFVARMIDGEKVTDLCKEYGISRKTAYKFFERFEQLGAVGLVDQSRAPISSPQRMSPELEKILLDVRKQYPTWGARKLLAKAKKQHPGVKKWPSHGGVSRMLKRHGLTKSRPRRHRPEVTFSPLSHAEEPQDVLCIDYKGEFRLGDGTLCYPLTLTDARSRYILACEAFTKIDGKDVRRVLELVFKEHGLPTAMRFDGGTPFASNALWGWSQLSVWLLRLGINLERIEPSSPQQNGRHERMHRTLKAETTRPAGANLLQQQERFDRFVELFNHERPHEALEQQPPASVYRQSQRAFPKVLDEPKYPLHDIVVTVASTGHIRMPGVGRRLPSFFITAALQGQRLGLRELDSGAWLVSFLRFDIGELNLATKQFVSYPPPKSSTANSSSPKSSADSQPTEEAQSISEAS